jgi:hypothetical protein
VSKNNVKKATTPSKMSKAVKQRDINPTLKELLEKMRGPWSFHPTLA